MDRKNFRFSRFCPRHAAAAMAAALAFTCGGAALAQPMMGPGGPMGHGPRGPGGFGEHIGLMLEEAKSRLALDTPQQQLWDSALAQTKSARESGRALHQKVRDVVRAELAKAEPDLAAIAAATDDAHAQGQALRRQVRDQWLKLYATFNAQQKAVVREMMQQRMERAERFRERMRERWGAAS
jgi:Spy/CpxP family protein refolding chaperone